MKILVDYNMEGQARLLFNTLSRDGWVDLLEIEFIYFAGAGLSPKSDDTTIWRYAQQHGLIILTDNRNREDETSLTATIERENTPTSLPVVTVGDVQRLAESEYCQAAALRLAEIIMYLENEMGTGRTFVP
jgi:predicted nuclease of predicted toxin-antitoxin system